MKRTAILLIHCPDQPGLVAAVANYILARDGNIVSLEEHVDPDEGVFFMRAEWEISNFRLCADEIGPDFDRSVARTFDMKWRVHFGDERVRLALFVSKLPHCLYDILARCESGEWNAEVAFIASNHGFASAIASRFGIPFYAFDVQPSTRPEVEAAQLALVEQHGVDTVILARYMQILSPTLVQALPGRIINIHHSFLPAFPGARPYHSAHARGVKIIGATSHYVTEELDEGPIIAQDVTHVSHRDSVDDLVRKGRDLEKLVLARAVWSHCRREVLAHGRRTVVFGR